MDLRLKGKSVLITGASKGIGLACAKAFAAEGCDIQLAARSADLLAAAASYIQNIQRVRKTMGIDSCFNLGLCAEPG